MHLACAGVPPPLFNGSLLWRTDFFVLPLSVNEEVPGLCKEI
jgi:hypothetical protein